MEPAAETRVNADGEIVNAAVRADGASDQPGGPDRPRDGLSRAPAGTPGDRRQTWLLILAVVLNLALFLLLDYSNNTGPSTWVTLPAGLVFSFVFEFGYPKITGRSLAPESSGATEASAGRGAVPAGPEADRA